MGTITTTALTTILDSVATGKLMFDASEGVLGTEANTIAKAASNDLATLSALADNDVQADLAIVFRTRFQGLLAGSLYTILGAYNLWWALDKHLQGLNAFLTTNNIRVSPAVQQVGFPIVPQNIMPPVVNPMASFAITGSGVGAYAHVADVDTTKYGPAWLDAVVTATVGAATINATIVGLQFDGATPVSKTVAIAPNSSVGTTVHVGTLGTLADSFDSITGITITGGTNGDAFDVLSRVERAIQTTS